MRPTEASQAREHAGQTRSRSVVRVLWITLALNWGVAGIKIVVGMLAGNLTVVADGFHSILDGTNNLLGIIAMAFSARPPDREHPYGHRKFEHVAAMIIGGLVVLLCYETLRGAAIAMWRRGGADGLVAASFPPWFFGLLFIGIGVNLFVARYERREGERLNSSLLKADAKHTLSDIAVTAVGLVSLATSHLAWWIDPLLAAGVGLFLLNAAYSILRDNVATMTDRSRLDPDAIRRVAESVDGVMDAHAIRSHGMENDIHVDLHVMVPGNMSAREVSNLEEAVRSHLMQTFPQVSMVGVQHETEEEAAPKDDPVWKT